MMLCPEPIDELLQRLKINVKMKGGGGKRKDQILQCSINEKLQDCPLLPIVTRWNYLLWKKWNHCKTMPQLHPARQRRSTLIGFNTQYQMSPNPRLWPGITAGNE